ncbi:DUF3999 domain-containing protein [Pseudomonas sp. AA-38]|uniref:DUF3999 domain-containing protein n=1 Tax=Pseudomonas sp. AA-38 TaxID=3028807 RepID=UPI0023F7BB73|nr:DUF3999 domain-containing protein [Pseudomonas sp. AA-38]
MRVVIALLTLLAMTGAGQAQERQEDYRQRLPLSLSGEGPWYRLQLPISVYFAARHADLRDVRVFDGQGQAQAYALLPGQAHTQERLQEHGVRWFPLYAEDEPGVAPRLRVQRSSDGTLIELSDQAPTAAERQLRGWLLDASSIEAPLVRLSLSWSGAEEGFQRFSIEASDDLQHWRSWGEGQVARLSFAGERIDQRQVELPGQRARYLRMLWQSPRQAPTLDVVTLRSRQQANQAAPLSWSPVLPARALGKDQYQWQLPQAMPLERLRMTLDAPNTLAPVRFEGRASEQAGWQPLATGLFYRLSDGARELRQDELALPGWPVSQLRLQVDARGGGLGQQPPRLQIALRASELVFLARGEPPFTLAVGNAGASSAALPLTTLIPGYRPERLATLGTAEADDSQAAVSEATSQADGHAGDLRRWGLWGLLLAGVALLAGMAFSLLRRAPDS